MAAEAQGRFLTGPTMGHVARMTFTGMAGLFFLFLVDFVTLFYVSLLGDPVLTAGVGFAWAVQFFTVSVGIGLGIATTALVSREIGAGRRERGRRLAGAGLLFSGAMLAAVAGMALLFRRPILALVGAEGEALETAAGFLLITLPSLPLVGLAMVAASTLRADGEARRAMMVTFSGGLVAVALDPFLIFGLGLGVEGAAMAMVASRAATALVGFRFCLGRNLVARPGRAELAGFLGPFFRVAAPAMATQLSPPLANLVLTGWVAGFGDEAVAGWAVASRLTVVAFGGVYALSGAIGGIIGQNFGARDGARVASAYRDALVFCAVYVGLVWAALALLAPSIAAAFGATGEGAEVIRAFCLYGAGGFMFNGAFYVANAAFNNLGRPIWSTALNWLRDGAATPLALLLVPVSAGAAGAVFAQAGAAVALGTLAVGLGWRLARRPLRPPLGPAPLGRAAQAGGPSGAGAAPALESGRGAAG